MVGWSDVSRYVVDRATSTNDAFSPPLPLYLRDHRQEQVPHDQRKCSVLAPEDPGYENIIPDNQVCTTVGFTPWQTQVNGYTYANTRRNFAIIIAFGVSSTPAYFSKTEGNTKANASCSTMLTNRGSKAENQLVETCPTGKKKAKFGKPRRRRWHWRRRRQRSTSSRSTISTNFTVSDNAHEACRLFHAVSGIVQPGRLTALMSESGTGKTRLLERARAARLYGQHVGTRLDERSAAFDKCTSRRRREHILST